jgi:ubiquinone/menaquinone biosynthesis C-methylase UbiE
MTVALAILSAILLLLFFLPRILVKIFNYSRPVPAFMSPFLDSRIRLFLQPPELILERSGVKMGIRVLDLGAGSGTYSFEAALSVGNEGKVIALDIQSDMLKIINEKLKQPENKQITNIEVVNADAAKMPFESSSFDVVIIVSVFQEFVDKLGVLKEVQRVLKNDGVLAISETFPDIDYCLPQTLRKIVTKAGFNEEETKGNWFNYTMRFVKKEEM